MATTTASSPTSNLSASPTLTASIDPLLSSFYELSWKDWDDNDGQKGGLSNAEDAGKIDKQSFYLGGKDIDGKNLFIARKPISEATTTFNLRSTDKLQSAGEYHPIDGANAGRMISDGKFLIETEGYQVLVAKPVQAGYANVGKVYKLSWVSYTLNGESNPSLNTCMQFGTNEDGDALYVCRASHTSKGKTGEAIGVFNPTNKQASIPLGDGHFTATQFDVLQVVPNTLENVERKMVRIAYAAYADKISNGSLEALGLSDSTELLNGCTFFTNSEVGADGFNLSPTGVVQIDDLTQTPNYVNAGYVANAGTGNLVIGLRGTMHEFSEVKGATYYDWANNFIAEQTTVTLNGITVGIHTGFYYATLSVFGTENTGIYKYVADELDKNDSLSIYLAGHSKGGAMANIMSLMLKDKFGERVNIEVATFGAPKIGNQPCANSYNQLIVNSYSYIYSADFVPWLPFDNEMVAFARYSWYNPTTAIAQLITGWMTAVSNQEEENKEESTSSDESNSAESPHALLQSSMSVGTNIGISLLLYALFDNAALLASKYKQYAISITDVNEMLSVVDAFNFTKDVSADKTTAADDVELIFQHIYKSIEDIGSISSLSDVFNENFGFRALGVATLVFTVAQMINDEWLEDCKDLYAYKIGTNFKTFVDEIVPNAVETLNAYGLGAKNIAMKERYARVGQTQYLFEQKQALGKRATGEIITCNAITPSMFFNQMIFEFGLQNVQDEELNDGTPIGDHSAYKSLFS